jgi:hypothetical protein
MSQHNKLLIALTVAALCAGCEGNGPSTQEGAVTGGALGAIAGGIIGHNSGGGNTLGGAIIGGVAGAIAGGAIGNAADHQNGTLYGSEQAATTTVVVAQPPPPPPPPASPDVYTPQPSPYAIWVTGYWAFNGANYTYTWIPGHWEIPPPGHEYYTGAHWAYRGGNYVYIRGYWR